MSKNEPPFALPWKRVDGHEATWYTVGYDSWDLGRITRHRAVYRINAEWREVFPDDDRDGAPFVDEWLIYVTFDNDREHFAGRRDGWDSLRQIDWRNHFATESEAEDHAIQLVTNKLEHLDVQREHWRQWLCLHTGGRLTGYKSV